MSFAPTPPQALLLFGLLARHGACAQAELMPKVTKADREALVKARFVEAGKVGRGLHLALADAGWGWTADNLSAELPPAQRTLSDLLQRLGEHLARSGGTLAEVIGEKPEAAPVAKPESKPRTKAAPKAPSPTALRKRIEAAYLAITGGKRDEGVKLSRLRGELNDLDRATVDAALARILAGDKKASLMRHDDPRQLAKADHAAAYDPAGEPFHVLWIAS